jgi:hypothetical protein
MLFLITIPAIDEYNALRQKSSFFVYTVDISIPDWICVLSGWDVSRNLLQTAGLPMIISEEAFMIAGQP